MTCNILTHFMKLTQEQLDAFITFIHLGEKFVNLFSEYCFDFWVNLNKETNDFSNWRQARIDTIFITCYAQHYATNGGYFLLSKQQAKSLRSFLLLGESFCSRYKNLPGNVQSNDDFSKFVKAIDNIMQKPFNSITLM